MAKKDINIFSISLLDLLSGALGAVIILYVIIPKISAAQVQELAELQKAKAVVADIGDILSRIQAGEELGHVDQALYDQLQEKFLELEETVSSLEGQLNNAMNDIAALQTQVAALQQALSECEENGEQLMQALASAQATNEQLAEQLEEEAEINNQLTAEIQALQEAMAVAQGEIDALAEELAQGEIDALTEELDLVIVMDFTGSMDEEIEDVKANANGLVKILQRTVASLKVGFVAYRDYNDDHPGKEVESIPLTATNPAGIAALHNFLDPLTTISGVDIPERVELGLKAAVDMNWRPEAKKVIVVIGDAQAHAQEVQSCMDMAAAFASQPRGEVAAINAGGDAEAANFFRQLAGSGKGDFVNSHGRMLESILLSVMEK